MSRLDAQFVAEALGAAPTGTAPEADFTAVGSDSRRVAPGELFIALAGPSFDGHDYVAAALAAGAAGAVVREGFGLPDNPQAFLLPVADPMAALGDLAQAWRGGFDAPVIAITGSNGKTTIKEMVAAIMTLDGEVLKNPGNFNNLIGLPLVLMRLRAHHDSVVLEMGMNAPGEIARLAEIALPDVGLVGNVGPAHLGMLGSMEAVAKAKAELFAGLPPEATAVVNLDDPRLAPYAESLDRPVITFGSSERADVYWRDPAALGGRSAFSLHIRGARPMRVRLATPGRHNVVNAAAAAAAALAAGATADMIFAGLEAFTPVKGRLNLMPTPAGVWLLDDTYNANPTSVKAGLAALKDVASGRRMGLILGDMFELGETSPQLHREVGQVAGKAGCRVVLALGEQAAQVAAGAMEAGTPAATALAFKDFDELMEAAAENLAEGDVVLVKGSRGMRMERVVKELAWKEGEA